MKSLLQRIVTVELFGSLLLGLLASQMIVLPLMADEFINISDIKGCRVIGGDAERLLCYDTVIDGGVFNEQQLKQVQVENFGSSQMRKEKAPEPAPAKVSEPATSSATALTTDPEASKTPATNISIDRISVTVTRTKKDATGIYYFQTSDGQVWKQKNASSWNISAPFEADLKAGMMGSFFLVSEGGKSTRVKRVK